MLDLERKIYCYDRNNPDYRAELVVINIKDGFVECKGIEYMKNSYTFKANIETGSLPEHDYRWFVANDPADLPKVEKMPLPEIEIPFDGLGLF